jgi:hypothetical protein
VWKLACAAVLTFLPGWLFIRYIRSRGRRLYDEFVLNLFRLAIDRYENLPAPPRHTDFYAPWKKARDQLGITTRRNLYRQRFEALYGVQAVSTRALFIDMERFGRWRRLSQLRDRVENLLPVLILTILIGLGWLVVLQPDPHFVSGMLPRLSFLGWLDRYYEMLAFGFLGVYLSILFQLVWRYMKADLKASAYVSSSLQIMAVALIIAVASAIPIGTSIQRNVFAFLLGPFLKLPWGLPRIAYLRSTPSPPTDDSLEELRGLRLRDHIRLVSEGIGDLRGFTSADLVSLLLHVDSPITEIVDRLDQAILYRHIPKDLEGNSPRDRLAQMGITTATGLERMWQAFGDDQMFRQELARAIFMNESADVSGMDAIIGRLNGDRNFHYVRSFRYNIWKLHEANLKSSLR